MWRSWLLLRVIEHGRNAAGSSCTGRSIWRDRLADDKRRARLFRQAPSIFGGTQQCVGYAAKVRVIESGDGRFHVRRPSASKTGGVVALP